MFISEIGLQSAGPSVVMIAHTKFPHKTSLDQAFAHCQIFHTAAKGWAVLSPNVAVNSPKPAKDSQLGELLPHQLLNLI
jgi:hypothetical protein